MDNLKRYQICHHLITYFATLIFPKKSYLGLIFRNGGSKILELNFILSIHINNKGEGGDEVDGWVELVITCDNN